MDELNAIVAAAKAAVRRAVFGAAGEERTGGGMRQPATGPARPAPPRPAGPVAPAATRLADAAAPADGGPIEDAGLAAREAGLVVGLFANPRTLAAAFIAAEILAKPVSLRERPDARSRPQ